MKLKEDKDGEDTDDRHGAFAGPPKRNYTSKEDTAYPPVIK